MAIAVSNIVRTKTKWQALNLITAASSNENYATGGLSLPASSCGLSKITSAYFDAQPFTGGAYKCIYNPTTEKLLLYWVDTTVDGAVMPEVPNATAIGVTVYTGFVFGV